MENKSDTQNALFAAIVLKELNLLLGDAALRYQVAVEADVNKKHQIFAEMKWEDKLKKI